MLRSSNCRGLYFYIECRSLGEPHLVVISTELADASRVGVDVVTHVHAVGEVLAFVAVTRTAITSQFSSKPFGRGYQTRAKNASKKTIDTYNYPTHAHLLLFNARSSSMLSQALMP